MTPNEIHADLSKSFGAAVGPLVDTAASPYVWVESARVRDVARHLRDRLGFESLACLSGVDTKGKKTLDAGSSAGEFWIVYHLASVRTKDKIAIKTRLGRENPTVPSVAEVWGAANWHEREAYDMYGIRFEGHPNLTRILCPEDWEGWPLRKDYEMPRGYRHVPHERTHSGAALLENPALLEEIENAVPKPAKGKAEVVHTGPEWHNPGLTLPERMNLVTTKGVFEKLFAAMAQTDCTSCGYDCVGYAEAIYKGTDTDISKCRPGGEETKEELVKILAAGGKK